MLNKYVHLPNDICVLYMNNHYIFNQKYLIIDLMLFISFFYIIIKQIF